MTARFVVNNAISRPSGSLTTRKTAIASQAAKQMSGAHFETRRGTSMLYFLPFVLGSELSVLENSNRPRSGTEKIPRPTLATLASRCEYEARTLPFSRNLADAD